MTLKVYMRKRFMVMTFSLLFAMLLFVGCGQEEQTMDTTEQPKEIAVDSLASLQADLDARKDEWAASAPDEMKTVFEDFLGQLRESGVAERAIGVGETAPDFALPNAQGDTVRLYELLEEAPVVLVWYRGVWCPYCNLQLAAYEGALPVIREAGGQMVAISPQTPEFSDSTVEKHNLGFEVLSDVGNDVADKYRLTFTLGPEVAKIYDEHIGLLKYNAEGTNELPLAATYVIDTTGTVVYAFKDVDYRKRAEPAEIVKTLLTLQKN